LLAMSSGLFWLLWISNGELGVEDIWSCQRLGIIFLPAGLCLACGVLGVCHLHFGVFGNMIRADAKIKPGPIACSSVWLGLCLTIIGAVLVAIATIGRIIALWQP